MNESCQEPESADIDETHFLIRNLDTGEEYDLRQLLLENQPTEDTAEPAPLLLVEGATEDDAATLLHELSLIRASDNTLLHSFDDTKVVTSIREDISPWSEYWKEKRQRHQILWEACEKGDVCFLDDILTENNYGKEELDLGGMDNWTGVHLTAANGNVECMILLIDKGANINVYSSEQGSTPLHLACRNNHLSCVGVLLSRKASVNSKDSFGNTPLHEAASNGHYHVCQMLMNDGHASYMIRNNLGLTALDYCGNKETLDVLLRCIRLRPFLAEQRKTEKERGEEGKVEEEEKGEEEEKSAEKREQKKDEKGTNDDDSMFLISNGARGAVMRLLSDRSDGDDSYEREESNKSNDSIPLSTPPLPSSPLSPLSLAPSPSASISPPNNDDKDVKWRQEPSARERYQNLLSEQRTSSSTGNPISAPALKSSFSLLSLSSLLPQTVDPSIIPPRNSYTRTSYHNILIHNSRIDVVRKYLFQHHRPPPPPPPPSPSPPPLLKKRRNLRLSFFSPIDAPSTASTPSPRTHRFLPVPPPPPNIFGLRRKLSLDDFIVRSLLGKGSFGEVYKVSLLHNPLQYLALKILKKEKIFSRKLLQYAITERNILSYSKCPFIIQFYGSLQTSNHFIFILEYCQGGTLHQLIKKCKRIKESVAKIYIAELLIALIYLHKRNIVYRDLKSDNIVLDKDGHIRLTDFGLAKESIKNGINRTQSFCGSLAYLSPEMIAKSSHDCSVDIYGLGLILYEMVVGAPPFFTSKREELFSNILYSDPVYPVYLSEEIVDLLQVLLKKKPTERLGYYNTAEIKNHPFFSSVDWNFIQKRQFVILPLNKNPTVQDIQGYTDSNIPLAPLLLREENTLQQQLYHVDAWSTIGNLYQDKD